MKIDELLANLEANNFSDEVLHSALHYICCALLLQEVKSEQ